MLCHVNKFLLIKTSQYLLLKGVWEISHKTESIDVDWKHTNDLKGLVNRVLFVGEQNLENKLLKVWIQIVRCPASIPLNLHPWNPSPTIVRLQTTNSTFSGPRIYCSRNSRPVRVFGDVLTTFLPPEMKSPGTRAFSSTPSWSNYNHFGLAHVSHTLETATPSSVSINLLSACG